MTPDKFAEFINNPDAQHAAFDAAMSGMGATKDGEYIDPKDFYQTTYSGDCWDGVNMKSGEECPKGWGGYHDTRANPAGLLTPFIEMGLSVKFAKFCLLHDLRCEWDRQEMNNHLVLQVYRGSIHSKQPPIWSHALDLRDLDMAVEGERYMDCVLDSVMEAVEAQILKGKGVTHDVTNAAHNLWYEKRDRSMRDSHGYGFYTSREFMEPIIRAKQQREREQAKGFRDKAQAQRDGAKKREHAEDTARYENFSRTYESTEEHKRAWEEILRKAGFTGRSTSSEPPPKAQPKAEFKAGNSYTDAQKDGIVKARKIKAMRDDERADKGTRNAAGNRLFAILKKHSLTEADLW